MGTLPIELVTPHKEIIEGIYTELRDLNREVNQISLMVSGVSKIAAINSERILKLRKQVEDIMGNIGLDK